MTNTKANDHLIPETHGEGGTDFDTTPSNIPPNMAECAVFGCKIDHEAMKFIPTDKYSRSQGSMVSTVREVLSRSEVHPRDQMMQPDHFYNNCLGRRQSPSC